MGRLLLLIWLLVLIGVSSCVHKIEGSGKTAEPPRGWLEFCQRNPNHKACS